MGFDKTTANKEIIFERRFSYPEGPHNIHMMWSLDAYDAGSWNGVYPTQNLVDAYETTDGKLIDDPTNTLYDPQNPYENRRQALLPESALQWFDVGDLRDKHCNQHR